LPDDGGSFSCVSTLTPRNRPLEYNKDAHIPESAEEEHLLREPLKDKIDVISKVKSIQHF
jgi:hypothetical protein